MKSVRTALRLLMEFSAQQPHFTLGELAQRTGLSKSHVSKLLAAFVESGLISQDTRTRTFSVGLRAFLLGARFVNYDRLASEAMPIMRELTERTSHSTRLSVLDSDEAIYVFGVEGPHFVDTGWRAGTRLPLHSTTAGRIFLAFMERKHAEALIAGIELKRLTPHTLTDRRALKRRTASIRTNGYDVQRGETTVGLGTIGVPLFGPAPHAIGVLSIAFPVHVIRPDAEPQLVALLHDAARTLSLRMGSAVYPFGGARAAIAQGGGGQSNSTTALRAARP